ncbi:sigma-E processing peptidase SpoIIGA [Limnochorda pilosa]|uniref:sigma-E processing peptidase SpoIIGA n=1 Tax=Limnochorda pilosa TaxID=1555112 RepID=UPI00130D715B|nr:sigma-E processing peptidase SpoIIGA [Limnochorda pilosa]
MELVRVVYVDLLVLRFLSDAAFNTLLLWTTARLAARPARWARLALAALLGAAYAAWETLAAAGVARLPALPARIALVVLVSWLMLAVSFDLSRPRSLFPLWTPFYGAVAAAAGAGFAAGFLLGDGRQPDLAVAMGGAAVTLAALGLWGPRWLRRETLQRSSELLVRVEAAGRRVEAVALLDTGNHLREPLSGWPVVVMEVEAAAPLFPQDLGPLVQRAAAGELGVAEGLHRDPEWAGRWRMIPFASLGTRHGMMLGFRPDRLMVVAGRRVERVHAVVGLSVQLLDGAGRYRALLPHVLAETASPGGAAASLQTSRKGEVEDDRLSTGT